MDLLLITHVLAAGDAGREQPARPPQQINNKRITASAFENSDET